MAFNLSKIAKGVALPLAAGAAKGYMAKRDELQKEFRENNKEHRAKQQRDYYLKNKNK